MSRAVRGFWPALRDKGVLVSGETLIDEIRSEARFHALRNIVRRKFLEFKFDSAVAGDGRQQIAVNVGLRIGGAADVLRQAIADRARRSYDPSRENFLLLTFPAGGIVNVSHIEVRMAGEHIDALAGLRLKINEGFINSAAALSFLGGLIHAVAGRKAVGQGFVHADDDGLDGRVGHGVMQNLAEPGHLRRVELVPRGVVQIDEINAALNPVVIRLQHVVGAVVAQPLLLDHGGIEPIGELLEEIGAGFRGNQFVVSDAEKNRKVAEGNHLVLNEVGPGVVEIRADVDAGAGRLAIVLIKIVDGAKVSQVPIKRRVAAMSMLRDRGHHHVATVARITGNGKIPRLRGGGLRCACGAQDHSEGRKQMRLHGDPRPLREWKCLNGANSFIEFRIEQENPTSAASAVLSKAGPAPGTWRISRAHVPVERFWIGYTLWPSGGGRYVDSQVSARPEKRRGLAHAHAGSFQRGIHSAPAEPETKRGGILYRPDGRREIPET